MANSNIINKAGEVVAQGKSDMDAVCWYLDNGRMGDRLAETNELMSDVAADLLPDVSVSYNEGGEVVYESD